jgi:hypothetical protein
MEPVAELIAPKEPEKVATDAVSAQEPSKLAESVATPAPGSPPAQDPSPALPVVPPPPPETLVVGTPPASSVSESAVPSPAPVTRPESKKGLTPGSASIPRDAIGLVLNIRGRRFAWEDDARGVTVLRLAAGIHLVLSGSETKSIREACAFAPEAPGVTSVIPLKDVLSVQTE